VKELWGYFTPDILNKKTRRKGGYREFLHLGGYNLKRANDLELFEELA